MAIDEANTTFVLVQLMDPGLAFFYGDPVSGSSVLAMMMQAQPRGPPRGRHRWPRRGGAGAGLRPALERARAGRPGGRQLLCLLRAHRLRRALDVWAVHGMGVLIEWARLLKLGRLHNATTHIQGGIGGAQLFLHQKHSKRISPTWDAYFDVEANGGNPFHDLVGFAGCRTVSDPFTDLSKIFDGGATCVNLTISMFAFKNKKPPGMPEAAIPPSRHVLRAAARFRGRAKLPAAYGALHVRRCDLLNEGRHQECTAVDSICKIIKRHSNYTAWFVSLYAEPGYRERLTRRLNSLGGRYVFEDEVELNTVFPGDNYFTLMVANEIKGGARLILDSHHCPEPEIRAIRGHVDGQYLQRFEDGELAEAGEVSRLRELASEEESEIARFGGWEGSASAHGATCNPGG